MMGAMDETKRDVPEIEGLPGGLEWVNSPAGWSYTVGRLEIAAPGGTDWFASPTDATVAAAAPMLLFKASAAFRFTARVSTAMESKWDAAALMVVADSQNWGKLAFEKSAYLEPTIVSVVTRGVSDDCNAQLVEPGWAWLRIGTVGRGIGFYHSADGERWKLVRVFSLEGRQDLRIGFEAQSPVGTGATAVFEGIEYRAEGIADQFAGE